MSQRRQSQIRFDGDAYVEAHPHLVRRNVQMLNEFLGRVDGGLYRGVRMIREDANLSAFLARQLVHETGRIEAQIIEALRVAEFVPVETGHPRGANSFATQMLTTTGKAKLSHQLAGDSPRVDVGVGEDLRKYVNALASYAYTVQDLEQAAMSGSPLPRWKGDACADEIARKLDEVGRIGSAELGMTGFFNNPSVPVLTLSNGEWNGTMNDTLKAAILADLAEIESTLISQSGDTAEMYGGYTLVLPPTYEGILATTPRSDASDISLKNWFLSNNRGLITSVERYASLETASGTAIGAADAPQGICYPRHPSVLYWPVVIPYEEQAPQLQGWEWVVHARGRCGEVDWRRLSHALYVENFD